jgi:hypothetical protein
MATANATPPKMTLDRSDGSATLELYRAALGPVHADYYLKAFTRFDAAGKTGPLWNWTAALLTLNWMLFRQLWAAALAYSGALIATALLLLGIARLVFQVSPEVHALLLGLAAVLAIGLPGAYGNAWLYAACNRKMERALVACATLEEACAQLAGKASGRQRMAGLLAGNVALCAAVAGMVFSWPPAGALPFNPAQQARALPVESLQSGLAKQSVGMVTAAPAAGASTPVAENPALVAPLLAASTASRVSQGMVQAAAPASAASTIAPVPAPAPAPATAMAAAPASAPAIARAPASAAAPVAPTLLAEPAKPISPSEKPPAPDKAPKSAKPTRAEKAEAAAKAAKEAKAAKAEKKLAAQRKQALAKAKVGQDTVAAKPQPAAALPAPAPAPSTHTDEKFLINVGLFADENNARNAFTKLKDAGLPALSQELKSSKGPRTRVRVGPFETQVEADRAAEKIRALQLEAAVFKQ